MSTPSAPSAPPVGPRPRGDVHGREPDRVGGLKRWPEESQEAGQLVIDTYGEPQEATESLLTWHQAGPWKRVLASKVYFEHAFPAPHIDSVESVIDYRVPPEQFSALAAFDGSDRRAHRRGGVGPLPRRAGQLPGPQPDARHRHRRQGGRGGPAYYAKEFLDARRTQPTPYMEKLRFQPPTGTPDPDQRVLSDQDLEQAQEEGKQKEGHDR